jgi:hypothetical protein
LQTLPYSVTLSIVLLACWHQREAVSPLDLVRWTLNGELPYLDFPTRCRDALLQCQGVMTQGFLTPSGAPDPVMLYHEAVEMARGVNLECPPINVGLWLGRFADELQLAPEVVPVALTLHDVYRNAPPFGCLQPAGTLLHPWAEVMSLLVMAARLTYGVGSGEGDAASQPSVRDWLAWAEARLDDMPGLCAYPMAIEEALAMPAPALKLYTQFVRRTVFVNYRAPDELAEYQRTFDTLASTLPVTSRTASTSTVANPVLPLPAEMPAAYRVLGTSQLNGMTSDYASLLITCSAFCWTAPRLLHEVRRSVQCLARRYARPFSLLSELLSFVQAVKSLERDVVNAELQVAYEADTSEQERIEWLRVKAARLKERRVEYERALARISKENA